MKLSIIIPTYNEENCIQNCLNSLINQTYKNFEIIIIDDGSTDDTLKKISKHKKIKIFKQNHLGPGAARNFGAKKSIGDILVFVDADMSFDKDYLKNLIVPLRNKLVIGTTHSYELATNTSNWISNLWGEIRVNAKEGHGNSVIFRAIRKKNFLEMGGFNSKYGYADDQTFWIEKKIKPYVAKNTICHHHNPETLKETFNQAKWIGASWKERFNFFRIFGINYLAVILLLFLLPLIVLIKSFKNCNLKISLKNKFKFYGYKFYGYFIGIKKAVLSKEIMK